MKKTGTTSTEKTFNEYFTKLVYAGLEDISSCWEGPVKYNKLSYESYTNLMQPKEKKADGVRKIFTVSTEVNQILNKMFSVLLEELGNIEIEENDNLDLLVKKLDESNPECITSFMFKIANDYKSKFGDTIRFANETSNWIIGRLKAANPLYVSRTVCIAIIYESFDNFLKSMAYIISRQMWFAENTVSHKVFLGVLFMLGMNQIMLDTLTADIRIKVKKPSTRKKVAKADEPKKDMPEQVQQTEAPTEPEPAEDLPENVDELENIISLMNE